MQNFSFKCSICGSEYQDETNVKCERCNGLFSIVYDLEEETINLTRDDISRRRDKGIWRFREFYPIQNLKKKISLGEGGTPLIKCDNLGEEICSMSLYGKNETINPTWSFKDRATSLVLTRANELSIKQVFIDSSGNAGTSLAAYSAHKGFECYVLTPAYTSLGKRSAISIYGAKLWTVNGSRDEVAYLAQQLNQRFNWYYCMGAINPYGIQGQKSLAYEICEQLGWTPPDWIVMPVGTGTSLNGVWLGLNELKKLNWISQLPKLACIQAEGCEPIVEAFKLNLNEVKPIEEPKTVAEGVAIGNPIRAIQILKDIRLSKGTAESVSDKEILEAQRLLAKKEGLFIEPTSAVAIAGLRKLLRLGRIQKEESVVCILTGCGLKALEKVLEHQPKALEIRPTVDSFLETYNL